MTAPPTFWNVYYPLVLSFVSARLILQTDLIMVSRFGESARAAFAVPLSVMFLDMMVAFSVGPVISVRLAGAKEPDQVSHEISSALSFALYAGVLLTVAGLFIYPALIDGLIQDTITAGMARDAVRWLTLAIPARLVQFVSTQSLHGLGRGREVVRISLTSIAGNAILNWLLMFEFGFGFVGSYIATSAWSVVTALWAMLLLRSSINTGILFAPPERAWLASFISKTAAEFWRVLSERLAALATVYAFSIGETSVMKLGVLAVVQEVGLFFTMPQVAFMRATAIYLRKQGHDDVRIESAFQSVRRPLQVGLAVSAAAAFAVFTARGAIGQNVYLLDPPSRVWWDAYVTLSIVGLPVSLLSLAQLGIWQSRQRFAETTKVSLFCTWIILIPCQFVGSRFNNPWLAWVGAVASSASSLWILWTFRRRLPSSEH